MNRPNLQGLVSVILTKADPLEAHRRAMTAQDKYNLDVQQALAPLVAPLVWTPLTPIGGWTAYSASTTTPAWQRDASGRIWLQGVVGGGSAGANLFSVAAPAPAVAKTLSCVTYDGAALKPGELVVLVDGSIQLARGSTTFVSLDSLSYTTS